MFDPVAYINEPRWQESRLGLERVRELLDRLGRPQDRLKFVHVAGTNGKGSTCAYLASILRCAGYKTGLFTSPYIETFEERIRVNGENISPDDLLEATLAVREQAEGMADHPTEFELMLAVALVHFSRCACDVVVLEVGLGGRFDATNVIDAPEVSVIARIGLDHTTLLGTTLAAVAGEKAGIIKSGASVVSYPQEPEAMAVVEAAAAAAKAKMTAPDFAQLSMEPVQWPLGQWCAERSGESTAFAGFAGDGAKADTAAGRVPFRLFSYGEFCGLKTALLGAYQPSNAALAIEVVKALRGRGWSIPDDAVREGIAATRWPGRFEVVASNPLFIVDGGHNPQGAQALADTLREMLAAAKRGDVGDADEAGEGIAGGSAGATRVAGAVACVDDNGGTDGRHGAVVFIVGVLADKDYREMMASVLPFADAFVTVTPDNPRALPAVDLAKAIREAGWHGSRECAADGLPVVAQNIPDAVKCARNLAGKDGVVVAFGSLYSVASLKTAAKAVASNG